MNELLSLASFNLHNLGAEAEPGRLHRLGRFIVEHLQAPTILAVQELAARAGDLPTVSGVATARVLMEAIRDAGGPGYAYQEVAPVADADGGQAGLNIRVGLLFDPARVIFPLRASADPGQTVTIQQGHPPRFSPNPGRIEPGHAAFHGEPGLGWRPSRKALTGEFQVAGAPLYIVNCHLKSMRARGRREALHARKQRHAQAERIAHFVRALLACRDDARLVVLGDFNDGINSRTLEILKASGLRNVLDTLPAGLRHTCNHGANLQTLDHLLISTALEALDTRIVHQRRCGLAPPVSDHDPILTRLAAVPVQATGQCAGGNPPRQPAAFNTVVH